MPVRPTSDASPPTLKGGVMRPTTETARHELRLTFDELALIYRALEAVKTMRGLPPQDELLNDTMQLLDQALIQALSSSA